MMETPRLLQKGPNDIERVLLESARTDGPPDGAKEKVLLALAGLTAGGGGPTGGSESALSNAGTQVAGRSLELGALAKLGLVAVVGIGLAGVAVHFYGKRSAQVHAPAAIVPASVAAPTAVSPPAPGLRAAPATAANPTAPSPAEVAPRATISATDESLGAEIRLLDQARAAVEARNPAAAERALEAYAQRFPDGRLRPEASVLRLTVLVRQGKRAEAKALASRLLASDPAKAYEPRVRSLLREAGQ